jgi:hypothetical protein
MRAGVTGSPTEAQPVMDSFAFAVAEAAGWGRGRVTVVYHEDELRGVARLAQPDASFALVPLPFFLKHEARLKLVAQVQAAADP